MYGGDVGPQSDDAPVAAPDAAESITDEQLKLLMVLFRERGFSGREHRLAWATVNVGRHITTSKDLTRAEASHLIDRCRRSAARRGRRAMSWLRIDDGFA